MNKLFLAGAIALFFAACSGNQKSSSVVTEPISTDSTATAVAPADSANAPVMSFENTAFDFGKVTDGEKVSYAFKFRNTGKTPLIITNALASCGCTVPDYPKTPVAPGAEGAISVVFNSAGKTGVQDKTITISSNAVPPTSQLHLTGEVKAKTN
jgi:hypothetical protein